MKYEDYFVLKKDSIFCAKTACVCDSCYLDITRYCTMGGTNMENVLRTLKQGSTGLPSVNKGKEKEKEDKKEEKKERLPKLPNFNKKKKNNNIY